MHIRASVPLSDDFFLLTIGSSSRYAIVPDGGSVALVDPGCSVHVAPLLQRLEQFKITTEQISFIVLTHCHADRITAAAAFKKLNPKIQIVASAVMADSIESNAKALVDEDKKICELFPAQKKSIEKLNPKLLAVDRVLIDGSVLQLSEQVALRMVATPGHTTNSCAYILEPHGYVIGDEVLGYYRGRELAAPGCDEDIVAAQKSLKKLLDYEISALCLPYGGVLTGELVPKHLNALYEMMAGLEGEVKRAREAGVTEKEIQAQIDRGIFSIEDRDPLMQRALKRSRDAILKQLK